MPYYRGFGVPWEHMSQYWHFGHISGFSCAPRAKVFKMVLFCFGPELMLIKGLKALNCLHANARSPSPLGTGDITFGVSTFGTTNPLFGNNGTKLHLPLYLRPWALCACCPRLRAILRRGHKPALNRVYPLLSSLWNARAIGWLNMGYAASCHCSCTIVPLGRNMVRGNLEGFQGAYIGTSVPCVYSHLGWTIARHDHGDMESSVSAVSANFRFFRHFRRSWEYHISMGQGI